MNKIDQMIDQITFSEFKLTDGNSSGNGEGFIIYTEAFTYYSYNGYLLCYNRTRWALQYASLSVDEVENLKQRIDEIYGITINKIIMR